MPGNGRPDLVRVGSVGKPHGVRGGFYVDGAIDPAALVPGFELLVGGRTFRVASRAGADARPILTLEGVTDRDAAVALRGGEITAERCALTPLGEGEWFASDLEGMEVHSLAGDPLGVVKRLINMPSVDVLEIAVAGGGDDLLIPMIGDAIISIDGEARAVTVNAGFLNLG